MDDDSLAVLRPELPKLVPGETYLIETVLRTLNIGHPFSQGTADSNEIWVDFTATSNGKVVGHNGATKNPDDTGPVDEWSHFVNVLMLDRNGNRIDRRNPQDIFTPLYDHQIPPGAANVVHYKFAVPKDAVGPIQLTVRLRYRKFDQAYMELIYKPLGRPVAKLPIVDICSDTVQVPLVAGSEVPKQESPIQPAWQRWNDYGIGCLLEGGMGNKKGNLRQAEAAFKKLLTLGVKDAEWHGHANLARVYFDLGRLNEAAKEIVASGKSEPPAPWWLRAWLSGLVTAENATTKAEWDEAAGQFAKIVDPANQPVEKNMDFTKDYVVFGRLGQTLFRRAQLESFGSPARHEFLLKAVAAFDRALMVDPEDLPSHYGLSQCYAEFGADTPAGKEPVLGTTEEIGGLVATIANRSPERTAVAVRLADAVTALGRKSPSATSPRLKPLQEARRTVTEVYRTETDPAAKTALAFALSSIHRELHILFKPDELARSAATKTYREKHQAANAAAEAIVIYPTDR